MTIINTDVVSIDSLTPHVLKIVLDAKQNLTFKAGQYLQVVMGEKDKRPFSIANMPSTDGLLELHIGATPDNPYAFEVVEKAKTTKQLDVEVGLGSAFLQKSNLPAILIAGGTGYSYTKSILFALLQEQPKRDVTLYWGAKNAADLYEAQALTELSAAHPQFKFVPVIENKHDDWAGKIGLVHQVVMDDHPELSNNQVYVAGRFEMAGVIKEAILPLGLLPENLLGDAFAFLK